MTNKTEIQYAVYAAMRDGMAWLVDTFDTQLAAESCADTQKGAAYVKKTTVEVVYRNNRRAA